MKVSGKFCLIIMYIGQKILFIIWNTAGQKRSTLCHKETREIHDITMYDNETL